MGTWWICSQLMAYYWYNYVDPQNTIRHWDFPHMGLSPLDLKMFRKVWPAHAISKIIFILGSNKFVACLEHIRSYAWSFGHSDPDPSSVQAHHQAVRFSPTQGLVPTEFENVPPGLTRRGRRRRWILAHFSGFIWRPFFTYVQRSSRYLLGYSGTCHTVGKIAQKCKETSNLMWLTWRNMLK